MAQAPPCPYCGAFAYELKGKRWLTCKSCGQEFDIHHDVCPTCGRLNKATATSCAYCAARLRQDTVDQIIAARGRTRQDWMDDRTTVTMRHKRDEQKASQERMEAYWAEEQTRREATARAALAQRKQERKVLTAVGIVTVVLILAMIAFVLLTSQAMR